MAFGPADFPAGPLTKGLKAIFMKAYDEAKRSSILGRIATEVTSDSDSEDYSWLGAAPAVREFLGERQARDLANFNYNIKNKTWENTIGVKRTDLEDNKLGMLTLRIQELAVKAAAYPEQLAMEFLTSALGSAAWPYLCYDGQGLIDTDHPAPVGGSAQDNREGSTLAIATLWVGITTMANFRDDNNGMLGISPDILLVEPYLEETARELVEDRGASTNTTAGAVLQKKGIEVLVSPYLWSSTASVANGNWFLIDSKKPVRPLIYQVRSPVEFGSLEKDSENGFMREVYYYGTRARYNIGSGYWPTIFGNAGAG